MAQLVHNFDEVYDRRGSDCKKYNPGKFPAEVLPMWIADTDFRCPAPAIEAAKKRLEHEAFGYPYELPEFNSSVKHWQKVRHGWDIEEKWVENAWGVIPAFTYIVREFANPGDQILCHTPLYSPLRESVRDNGRELVSLSMINTDNHYTIDFDAFEKALQSKKARMYILCNPHNPTGRVFTEEELRKIGDLCKKYKVLVFSDEIHGDIIYEGYKHIPFASLSPEYADFTITGINPGKTFNVAGIRTGAVIISNPEIMKRFIIARQASKGLGRTVVGQQVFIACYQECEYYVDQLVPYLQANMEYAYNFIKDRLPEIKMSKPEGMYLLWMDCRSLGLSQADLMKLFAEVGKIGLNSGTEFGPEGTGYARLNIAVPRATLEEGMHRVETAIKSTRK